MVWRDWPSRHEDKAAAFPVDAVDVDAAAGAVAFGAAHPPSAASTAAASIAAEIAR